MAGGRQAKGCGRPYRAEVVARAKTLMEGTTPFGAIVAELGIGRTTLHRWWKRYGWVRPEGPVPRSGPRSGAGWCGAASRSRRRGHPIYGAGIGAVRDLVTGTLLSQAAISRRTGVSQERISAWMRRHNWVRPEPRSARRFAAARRVGLVASEGDRRGRPYAASVRAEARNLWEETLLPTFLIGARLGIHAATVSRWAKADAWIRPKGRLGRAQLRGYFGLFHPRPGRAGPRVRRV